MTTHEELVGDDARDDTQSSDDPQAQEAASNEDHFRTCPCRGDVRHPFIRPEPEYDWLGILLLNFGITARAKRVKWVCRKCDRVVRDEHDPAAIKSGTS